MQLHINIRIHLHVYLPIAFKLNNDVLYGYGRGTEFLIVRFMQAEYSSVNHRSNINAKNKAFRSRSVFDVEMCYYGNQQNTRD